MREGGRGGKEGAFVKNELHALNVFLMQTDKLAHHTHTGSIRHSLRQCIHTADSHKGCSPCSPQRLVRGS